GASHVALTPFDAQRLGFDINALDYRIPYQTANGIAYAAPVRLEEISIGSITVRDVRASVSKDGLSQSLLGMSFLGQLTGVELSGDRLILRE
ncbi:MAG: TIGR02281 family clan AA aspartic protease, partial [Kangiella sp.]|nr:TIGR02281 family clan AA aspartic protease [Kangiella sp.]